VPDRRLCKSRLASLEPIGLRRAGVVRHGSRRRLQQTATGVAPRSADGFGRTVTRGCVASGGSFYPVPLPVTRAGCDKSSIPHGSGVSVHRSHSSSKVVWVSPKGRAMAARTESPRL